MSRRHPLTSRPRALLPPPSCNTSTHIHTHARARTHTGQAISCAKGVWGYWCVLASRTRRGACCGLPVIGPFFRLLDLRHELEVVVVNGAWRRPARNVFGEWRSSRFRWLCRLPPPSLSLPPPPSLGVRHDAMACAWHSARRQEDHPRGWHVASLITRT